MHSVGLIHAVKAFSRGSELWISNQALTSVESIPRGYMESWDHRVRAVNNKHKSVLRMMEKGSKSTIT